MVLYYIRVVIIATYACMHELKLDSLAYFDKNHPNLGLIHFGHEYLWTQLVEFWFTTISLQR